MKGKENEHVIAWVRLMVSYSQSEHRKHTTILTIPNNYYASDLHKVPLH